MTHRDGRRRAAILAGLVMVAAVILWLAERRNGFFDLKVYSGAVHYWVHNGGLIYDWVKPRTPYGFTYPPFAAVLMAPMAVVSFPLAVVVASIATAVSTAVVVWWLIEPTVRRMGWPQWYALAVACCLAAAFEPVRETFSFGQVNTLLLLLVVGDLLHGVAKGRRWAGVGIGVATAIKLTPGVFILYLLVTRRWRAAATAIGAAAVATLAAAAIAPKASVLFWTSTLWDTGRVGNPAYVANQSLRGLVARLPLTGHAGTALWLALAAAAFGCWVWRVRAAHAAGDERAGLALTGVFGCLVSPVSWVHHLVFLLPALALVVDAGLAAARGSRGRRLLWFGLAAYVLMSSRLLWVWERHPHRPLGHLGSNIDVFFAIALLVLVPIRAASTREASARETPAAADLGAGGEVHRIVGPVG
jgi:alpha-1,2-mannosyltransferase